MYVIYLIVEYALHINLTSVVFNIATRSSNTPRGYNNRETWKYSSSYIWLVKTINIETCSHHRDHWCPNHTLFCFMLIKTKLKQFDSMIYWI